MAAKTKYCPRCKEVKTAKYFGKNSSRKDGMQSYCLACRVVIDKEHYDRNRTKICVKRISQRKATRFDRYTFLFEYFKTHPCIDCGETDPVVLEFDHYKGVKSFNISDGIWRSRESIKQELKKCRVLCANCHRRRTAKQFGWYKGLID